MMPPGDAQQLVRLSRQLRSERAAAKPIIEELRGRLTDRWEAVIPDPWKTAGFVQQLTTTSAEVLESNPQMSIALALFALAVVSKIPEASYPRPVLIAAETTAWKELANAHRHKSEYDAAIRALDAAERCLAQAPSLAYDRAVVLFARALAFADMRRFAEATPLLAESAEVFRQYRDERRVGQSLLVQGMVEHRSAQFTDAAVTFGRAAEVLKRTGDLHSLAAAYSNLAHAEADLGNLTAAAGAAQDALAILKDLGASGDVLRTQCVLGRMLLAAGRYQRAKEMFLEARAGFRSLGMPEEAGLAGLELSEAFIALGSPERAAVIVDEVLSEFRQAGLNDRAATALAYLRTTIATPRAAEAVRHVRSYVERLRNEPRLVFVPLQQE